MAMARTLFGCLFLTVEGGGVYNSRSSFAPFSLTNRCKLLPLDQNLRCHDETEAQHPSVLDYSSTQNREKLLLQLLEDAGLVSWKAGPRRRFPRNKPILSDITVKPIGDGFSNWVYRIDGLGKTGVATKDGRKVDVAVVKIFSPLAKVRSEPTLRGVVDGIASAINVGPKLLHRSEHGIVMSFVDGVVLREEDIHGDCKTGRFGDGRVLCKMVARRVAHLHAQTLPPHGLACPNILWHSLDRMISFISEPNQQLPDKVVDSGWTILKIHREIEDVKQALRTLQLPLVLAHGDLKPSNIMLSSVEHAPTEACLMGGERDLFLIDFELSGMNYRGYDICKLFRSSKTTGQTVQNMESFARSYADEMQKICGVEKAARPEPFERILSESALFESLTWLEAGIFFLFAAKGDLPQTERWADLACDRLKHYEACKTAFRKNLDLFRERESLD